jgi:hypothetical protein
MGGMTVKATATAVEGIVSRCGQLTAKKDIKHK